MRIELSDTRSQIEMLKLDLEKAERDNRGQTTEVHELQTSLDKTKQKYQIIEIEKLKLDKIIAEKENELKELSKNASKNKHEIVNV